MPTLLLIVFINLVGFGLLIPLLPFYAVRLDVSPAMVTMATNAVPLLSAEPDIDLFEGISMHDLA